jgi:hypothetical protein
VFSRKAATALAYLPEGNGELFPLLIADEEDYLFNVIRVIDALDESRSEIIRFDGTSRVMEIAVHYLSRKDLKKRQFSRFPRYLP